MPMLVEFESQTVRVPDPRHRQPLALIGPEPRPVPQVRCLMPPSM